MRAHSFAQALFELVASVLQIPCVLFCSDIVIGVVCCFVSCVLCVDAL